MTDKKAGSGGAEKAVLDDILVDTTAIIADIADLDADVVDLAASIMDLTEAGDTITTDGTEQNLYINNAPAGLYQPLLILVDFTNHTAGETIEIKEYYRIILGGALLLYRTTVYAGVVDPPLISQELLANRFGIQVTIELTAGANRDYDWEVVYKI